MCRKSAFASAVHPSHFVPATNCRSCSLLSLFPFFLSLFPLLLLHLPSFPSPLLPLARSSIRDIRPPLVRTTTCPHSLTRVELFLLRDGAIVALFLVCARQCSVAPLVEFACRQHGGRCGGATIVVSKRGECNATTAAPSRCPERRVLYRLLSSAATPPSAPPCPPSPPPPPLPPFSPSPLSPGSFLPLSPSPPLPPSSLAATTTATVTTTSRRAGRLLAFVQTGNPVIVKPAGKKTYIYICEYATPERERSCFASPHPFMTGLDYSGVGIATEMFVMLAARKFSVGA